ncbi:glycine-rich RNA-binding protein 2, mitochondrial-like, partial [Triticum dicoccoides]|uniref:glycine-rich RNA-binding protein 2, mitochondrial-like n=1 Tax=Triticum dicoccoides TaxID=85692 RepID=UPI00189019A3
VALKDAFSQHGDVIQVKVICHPVTGRSKGYVLVKFSSETEAAAALEKMSDEVLDGKKIRVDYANSGQSAAVSVAADE